MINHIIYALILVTIADIFFFRKYKKNIFDNYVINFILILILFVYFYIYNPEKIGIILIFFLLYIVNFKLIFTGIKNSSPSLYIIHLIVDNSAIKKKFLKQNFCKKRIIENLYIGIILKKNREYQITKKGKIMLILFNNLKKIFNL